MTAPQIRVASAQSTVRTAVARALATALVTGIDNAAEEGRPLTQLQQIDLAVSHVMAYDEAIKACETIAFESRFARGLAEAEASASADTHNDTADSLLAAFKRYENAHPSSLLADNQRLRETLSEIASFPFGDGRSQARARAALASTTTTATAVVSEKSPR